MTLCSLFLEQMATYEYSPLAKSEISMISIKTLSFQLLTYIVIFYLIQYKKSSNIFFLQHHYFTLLLQETLLISKKDNFTLRMVGRIELLHLLCLLIGKIEEYQVLVERV